MSEKNKPFVITDRRKFTLDGEPRPDADPSPEKETREPAAAAPPPPPAPEPPAPPPQAEEPEPDMPPAPTAEQTEQSRRAYEMTADRLNGYLRTTSLYARLDPDRQAGLEAENRLVAERAGGVVRSSELAVLVTGVRA